VDALGWTRRSPPAPAGGAPNTGAPRSSTSGARPICSTWSLAAPAAGPSAWLEARPEAWRDGVAWRVLDLSGPYRKTFTDTLPEAGQVADPFHLVKHTNSKLDECRRRVRNETLGHRGRRDDPLYRSRRLLTKGNERLDDDTDHPPDLRSLGRTLHRWHEQIVARYRSRVSNGPTEAANNLIKRVKRVAFGFRRFAHYRIRVLLYAGRPNWDLLATVTPR
jgi:transposase